MFGMTGDRVRWQDVDRDTYEQMTAVLISRLYPNAQRIDGSGGDGGRDVQVPLETGLEIFQLKSHTGRMKASQRSQVRDSLRTATQRNPAAWHLVVPIDHTPGELEWFENLTKNYPFPCLWHGLTWLDTHMAKMPEIARYYLEDARDEIIRLARQLQLEQMALSGGIFDAIDRFIAIQEQLDGLDPHYTFHLSSHPDGRRSVAVVPRYSGALTDAPILVRPEFLFPDTPEARDTLQALQDTINYGSSCTISSEYISRIAVDMPAGLGGEYESGELTLGAADSEAVPDLTAQLQVRNDGGIVTTQLPLRLIRRTAGQRGGILNFLDASGAVTATLRLDATSRQANFNYHFSEPDRYSPTTLLPTVRFVAEVGRAASVAVLINGMECGVGEPTLDRNHAAEAKDFATLLEALVFLQTHTSIYFEIRGNLTPDEVHDLDKAVRLLRGEVYTSTWTSLSIVIRPEGMAMMHATGLSVPQQIRVANELSIIIQDVTIPVGKVVNEIESARVSDDTALLSESDDPLEITFIPGETNTVRTWLQTG